MKIFLEEIHLEVEKLVNNSLTYNNHEDENVDQEPLFPERTRNESMLTIESVIAAIDDKYFEREYNDQLSLFSLDVEEKFSTFIGPIVSRYWAEKDATVQKELYKNLFKFLEDDEIQEEVENYLMKILTEGFANMKEIIEKVKILMLGKGGNAKNGKIEGFLNSVRKIFSNSEYQSDLSQNLHFISQTPKITKSTDRTSIEIEGFKFRLSTYKSSIENLFDKHTKIVKIFSSNTFFIDCDLSQETWHGKNLSICAEKIVIIGNPIINLSGITESKILSKAPNAKNEKEDGKDGSDGKAGESSGNLMVLSKEVKNFQNLKIFLNGADGKDGQEGGDGFNGMNGAQMTRTEFEKLMPKFGRSINGNTEVFLQNFRNFDWKKVQSLIFHEIDTYDHYEGVDRGTGQKCIFSISLNMLGFVHAYMLVQGASATKATKGGRGGFGGQGGFRGKCIVNVGNDGEKFQVDVEAFSGKSGKNGEGGKNGKPGMDGCDVGFIQTPRIGGNKRKIYGGEGKKIRLHYFKSAKEDSCYSAYIRHYLNEKECYVSMVSYPQEFMATETYQRNMERKKEGERSDFSMAKKMDKIDRIEIEKQFLDNLNKFYEVKKRLTVKKKVETQQKMTKVSKKSQEIEENVYVYREYERPIIKQDSISELSDEESSMNGTQQLKPVLNQISAQALSFSKMFDFEYELSDLPELRRLLNEMKNDQHLLESGHKVFENIEKLNNKVILMEIQEFGSKNDGHFGAVGLKNEEFEKNYGSDPKFLVPKIDQLSLGSSINALNLETKEKNLRSQKIQKFVKKCQTVASTQNHLKNLVHSILDLKKLKINNLTVGSSKFGTQLGALLMDFSYMKNAPGLSKFGEDAEKVTSTLEAIAETFSKPEFNASINRVFSEICEVFPNFEFESYDGKNGLKAAEKLLDFYFLLKAEIELILALKKVVLSCSQNEETNTPFHIGYENLARHEKLIKVENKIEDFQEFLLENGPLCAGYRMIEAFLHKKNLKFYKKDMKNRLHLIQDCFIGGQGKTDEHILIENGKFYGLGLNFEKIKLFEMKLGMTKFIEEHFKNFFVDNIFGSAEEVEDFKSEVLDLDPETVKYLEKLAKPYLPSNKILRALKTIFTHNGIQVSSNILKFLVNTCLATILNFGTDIIDYIAMIILATPQKFLLDKLILVRIENFYGQRMQFEEKILNKLSKISNDNKKFLLCTKLETISSDCLSENDLITLLKMLSYSSKQYRELSILPLEEWKMLCKAELWAKNLRPIVSGTPLEKFSYHLDKLEGVISAEQLQEFKQEVLKNNFSNEEIMQILFRMSTGEEVKNCSRLGATIQSRKSEELLALIESSTNDPEIIKNIGKLQILMQYTALKLERNQILWEIFENLKIQEDTSNLSLNLTNWLAYPEKWIPELKKDYIQQVVDKTKFYPFLLQIVDEVIYLKRGYRLRDSHKIAILSALTSNSKLLMQVATGEGKSLIIAVIAIIKAIEGETVDVITSSHVLAKRDADFNKDNQEGMGDLYAYFGVKVGHNCDEDSGIRRKAYQSCSVVYGDLGNFQRDFLLDTYYNKNILGSRSRKYVIIDEVDNMLLDNANHVLYLSHSIAGMETLNPLFLYIWHCVSRPVVQMNENLEENQEDVPQVFDSEFIKNEILKLSFGITSKEALTKVLELHPPEINKIWRQLVELQVINEDGCLKPTLYGSEASHVFQSCPSLSKILQHRLADHLKSVRSKFKLIQIPIHLQNFVFSHLDQFIESAKLAKLKMHENIDYVIETPKGNSFNRQIIIVDRSTGTDLLSTQWNNGLHQFLQLKHGCKLTPLSTKAVFVSNVTYLNRYANLIGLSGTLGSGDEENLLKNLYAAKMLKVPTDKPKQFYEQTPIIVKTRELWKMSIFNEILCKIKHNRSILVIMDSINDVNEMKTYIQDLVTKKLDSSEDSEIFKILADPKNILTYTRDYVPFIYGEEDNKNILKPQKVLIATNLAGRGTDIKLDEELVKNGGLHVVVAFCPKNIRIEEQAFGRAARGGDLGSARMIIRERNIDEDGLIKKRDLEEKTRLKLIKNKYEKITKIEEECFSKFGEKFQQLGKDLDDSPESKLKQKAMLDRWALWLDNYTLKNCINHSNLSTTTEKEIMQIFEHKNYDDIPPLFIKSIMIRSKSKQHFESMKQLTEWKFVDYSAEIKYYMAYLILKLEEGKINLEKFKMIKQLLAHSRLILKRNSINTSIFRELIEFYKNYDQHRGIENTGFDDQQMNFSKIFRTLVTNIDDLIGHRIDPSAFISPEIDEDLAHEIFEKLKMEGVILEPVLNEIEDWQEEEVARISRKYKIPWTKLKNFLSLRTGQIVEVDDLRRNLNLPNLGEFWEMAKNLGIIKNVQKIYTLDMIKFKEAVSIETKTCQPNSFDLILSQAKIDHEKWSSDYIQKYFNEPEFRNDYLNCDREILSSILSEQHIQDLSKCGAIIENESGILTLNQGNFPKFDSITTKDLSLYGIPEEEAEICINKLVSNGILLKSGEVYKLKNRFDNSKIPAYYHENLHQALEISFAYRIAYKQMIENFKLNNDKNTIPLISHPEELLFYELCEVNLIEPYRVNYANFDKRQIEKLLSEIVPHEKINFIYKILKKALPTLLKLKHHDIKLNVISEEFMKSDEVLGIEAKTFENNGLPYVISMKKKFWIRRTSQMLLNVLPMGLEMLSSMITVPPKMIARFLSNGFAMYTSSGLNFFTRHDGEFESISEFDTFQGSVEIAQLTMEPYTQIESPSISSGSTMSSDFYQYITNFHMKIRQNWQFTEATKKLANGLMALQKHLEKFILATSISSLNTNNELEQIFTLTQEKLGPNKIKEILFSAHENSIQNSIDEITTELKSYLHVLKKFLFIQLQNISEVKMLDTWILRTCENFEEKENFKSKFEHSIAEKCGWLKNEIIDSLRIKISENRLSAQDKFDPDFKLEYELDSKILETWLKSYLKPSLGKTFQEILPKFQEDLENRLHYIMDTGHGEDIFQSKSPDIFLKQIEIKEKLFDTEDQGKREQKLDPLKEDYDKLSVDLYMRTHDSKWIAAAVRANAFLDARCLSVIAQGLHKVLAKRVENFTGIRLVLLNSDEKYEFISSPEYYTDLAIELLDHQFQVAPRSARPKNCSTKTFITIMEALVHDHYELTHCWANSRDFCEELASEIVLL